MSELRTRVDKEDGEMTSVTLQIVCSWTDISNEVEWKGVLTNELSIMWITLNMLPSYAHLIMHKLVKAYHCFCQLSLKHFYWKLLHLTFCQNSKISKIKGRKCGSFQLIRDSYHKCLTTYSICFVNNPYHPCFIHPKFASPKLVALHWIPFQWKQVWHRIIQ